MIWLCRGIVNPRRTVNLNLLQHHVGSVDRVQVRMKAVYEHTV